MNKNTLINLRLNQELKEQFQEIVTGEGYTMSEVIEASMKDVVNRGKIPIYIRSHLEYKPNNLPSIVFIKKCIDEVMNKYGEKVQTVSLFGSYSKGTATNRSDIDLFLEVDDEFSLFDLTEIQLKLEKELGKKTDLLLPNKDEQLMSQIQREKIQLYERRS